MLQILKSGVSFCTCFTCDCSMDTFFKKKMCVQSNGRLVDFTQISDDIHEKRIIIELHQVADLKNKCFIKKTTKYEDKENKSHTKKLSKECESFAKDEINMKEEVKSEENEEHQSNDNYSKYEDMKQAVKPIVQYKCSVCDKKFSKRSILKEHYKTHAEKNYECSICDKKFALKTYLKKHILTHTGKHFECKVCDKNSTKNFP